MVKVMHLASAPNEPLQPGHPEIAVPNRWWALRDERHAWPPGLRTNLSGGNRFLRGCPKPSRRSVS